MKTLFLGLGSNLGNRIATVNRALGLLKQKGRVIETSFMYETSPMIVKDQPKFLNAVLKYETNLSPIDALNFFESIERELGCPKPKAIVNGPRMIDIDILFYDNLVIDEEKLKIPHPRISERDFVLLPFSDIEPNLRHPTNNKTIKELLNALYERNGALSEPVRVLAMENRTAQKAKDGVYFDLDTRTLKMGIVNLTPDSIVEPLYAKMEKKDKIHEKIALLLAQKGASYDMLDVGGESTRPGAKMITLQEEMDRVGPVLEEFCKLKERQNSLLSLDTNKVELAQLGLDKGVSIINDISSVNSDEMLKLIAEKLCPVILMHNRGNTENHSLLADYKDFEQEYTSEMNEKTKKAQSFGIPRWNILTSPGFGFAKKPHHNIDVIRNLDSLKLKTGRFPFVAGFSNKGFLKRRFGDNPFLGNALYTAVCIQKGANIIRYHDPQLSEIIDHLDEIYKTKRRGFPNYVALAGLGYSINHEVKNS